MTIDFPLVREDDFAIGRSDVVFPDLKVELVGRAERGGRLFPRILAPEDSRESLFFSVDRVSGVNVAFDAGAEREDFGGGDDKGCDKPSGA